MVYNAFLVVFVLLVAVVVLASIANWVRVPYAVLLVTGGLLLGYVPGLPSITLDPQLVLFVFLPPLIYSSAWFTSWRDFHANVRSILVLAIGLVLATTTIVAAIGHFMLGIPWAVAFVLGALVSPTDAVAASATVQRLGVARRLVTVIEGESMVNDATGLVTYRFAVAAVVSGTFTLWQAGFQFVLSGIGGILIGLVVAWPVAWLHRHLDDATREITITLLTPFAAYLLADLFGLSGVLAVLAAGLYLSRQSSTFFSANTRLRADSFWNVLVFVLNGLLFILVGLQLHAILNSLGHESPGMLVWSAVIVTATVIIVRLGWIFLATPGLRALARLHVISTPTFTRAEALILGWSGMRGGVSLAAALALPVTLASGAPFPSRNLLIFLTFGVILGTLIGQGLTLEPLIHALGIQTDNTEARETLLARRALTEAALTQLDELSMDDGLNPDAVTRERTRYEMQLADLSVSPDGVSLDQVRENSPALRQVRQSVLRAQRAKLILLRNRGKIDDGVLRRLEYDLDLEEQHLDE